MAQEALFFLLFSFRLEIPLTLCSIGSTLLGIILLYVLRHQCTGSPDGFFPTRLE